MRPTTAASAAAAVLMLSLCSCGSTSTSAPSSGGTHNVLASAYAATVATRTGAVTLAVHEDAAGQIIAATGEGEFDWAARDGSLSLTIGAAPSGSISLQEVLEPGTVYVKVPASLSSGLGTDKPWVAVPFASGTSSALSGPDQVLSILLADSSGVTRVGTATVDGVTTTEYSADLDPSKAAADIPANLRSFARQALRAAGIKTIPVKVYVDQQGRCRRVTEQLSFNVAATGESSPGGTVTGSVQLDIGKFGLPVTVSAPPADQVGTSPALAGLFGGAGTGAEGRT